MFNDDVSFAFNNMHEFSTADGFVEITESLAEMIKYAANEPSVGLFYIQHHTQNAVPNLVNLKNDVAEKSRQLSLHAEDLEDSITSVRCMKDCGFQIADEMIKEITKSLSVVSTKQAKSRLTRNSSSWGPSTWGSNAGSESGSNYISSVLKSAKERATNFKWTDPMKGERHMPCSSTPVLVPDTEVELPVSRQFGDGLAKEVEFSIGESSLRRETVLLPEKYEEFRADREAKLEEWLGGTNNEDHHAVGEDSSGRENVI